MRDYWSCSKFADWLRGTAKPSAASTEEWCAWEKIAKVKKIRYWLAEEFLDTLQRFIFWPVTCIKRVYGYIINSWVTKTHCLKSKLKPGSWYDLDTRLIHSIFDELVNFVEIEQAWMEVVFSKENRKKYKTPWHRTFIKMGVWRCPEAGIAHLKWASELKNDEEWRDKNSSDFGQLTQQALNAREIFMLYRWWKEERPKRLDPSEESGWSTYCHEKQKIAGAQGEDLFCSAFLSNTNETSRDLFNKYNQIQKAQDDEDTEMLIRLINIRHSLWT